MPISAPVRSANPTFEPITLAEAKRQVGVAIDSTIHDEPLSDMIQTAREAVENDTGLALATGTFTWKFTDWPACEDYFEIRGVRPITSITSIAYLDTNGDSQTWGASNYALETSPVVPLVRLTYGSYWPVLRGDINGITVTFVAGYSSAAAIPQTAKDCVKLQVHLLWALRMEMDTKSIAEGYERLIQRITRRSYP